MRDMTDTHSPSGSTVAEAEAALDTFGSRAEPLCALGRFILERRA